MRLRIAHEPLQPDRWADRDTTFAGMLQNLLDSAAAASEAKSMGKNLCKQQQHQIWHAHQHGRGCLFCLCLVRRRCDWLLCCAVSNVVPHSEGWLRTHLLSRAPLLLLFKPALHAQGSWRQQSGGSCAGRRRRRPLLSRPCRMCCGTL